MLFAVGDGGSVFKNEKLVAIENEVQELKGIYPNPSSGWLKIPVDIISQVSIINMNGEFILNKTINPGEFISLEEFAPGMYTVFVTNAKGRSTGKVVVQR